MRAGGWPLLVDHYTSCLDLGLTASQRTDLIEYLKSL